MSTNQKKAFISDRQPIRWKYLPDQRLCSPSPLGADQYQHCPHWTHDLGNQSEISIEMIQPIREHYNCDSTNQKRVSTWVTIRNTAQLIGGNAASHTSTRQTRHCCQSSSRWGQWRRDGERIECRLLMDPDWQISVLGGCLVVNGVWAETWREDETIFLINTIAAVWDAITHPVNQS